MELAGDTTPDFTKILLTALGVEGLLTYFELQEAQTQAGNSKHSSNDESTDEYVETLKMLERHFRTQDTNARETPTVLSVSCTTRALTSAERTKETPPGAHSTTIIPPT